MADRFPRNMLTVPNTPPWSKLNGLRSAASEDQIRHLEAGLGVSLPTDYRQFLCSHDGQTPDGAWVDECRLLTVAEILPTWKELATLDLDFTAKDSGVKSGFRERWIPIANLGRRFIVLDLEPAEGGVTGQVLGLFTDDDDLNWIARSFSDACLRLSAATNDIQKDVTPAAPNPQLSWVKSPETMVRSAGIYVASDRRDDVRQAICGFWRKNGNGQVVPGDALAVPQAAWKSDGLLGNIMLPTLPDAKGQVWTSIYDSAPKRQVLWTWGEDLAKSLHRELGIATFWFNIGPKTRLDTSSDSGSFGSAGVVRGTRNSWKVIFDIVKQLPFPFFTFEEINLYDATVLQQGTTFVLKFDPARLPTF
jgi:cell wall assembly regulator SMI1